LSSTPTSSSDDTRTMGVLVFLAAVTTLLAAALVGHWIVRLRLDGWPPAGLESPLLLLWTSTVLLLALSVALHRGLVAVRRNDLRALSGGLNVACVLATGFLVTQALAARTVLGGTPEEDPGVLYAFTHVMLIALHGVHVAGGLIPLAIVTRRAALGAYDRESHGGVRLLTFYWHYLDVVWLVMFTSLAA